MGAGGAADRPSVRVMEGQMGAAQVNERAGVVPDFRQSDILRPGFAPLTTRFSDIWDGVDRLKVLVERGDHHEVATSWRRVT